MSGRFAPKRLSPQLRQPSTTRAMMLDMIVALTPALGMAVFFFGLRALALCAVSIASCVLFELVYRLFTRQSLTIGDLSACVTGLLLALSLPASTPYWVPVMGAAFGIIVVKQFYGGMGRNFMNPALAGRMLAGTMPILMTTWPQPMQKLSLTAVDAVSAATPMSYLHGNDLSGLMKATDLPKMFVGLVGGSMGEVSAMLLILGGLFLLWRKVITWYIPVSYIGTVAALTFLFPRGNDPLQWMLCNLLGGGLMLGAIFMATDYVTSPVSHLGQAIFGIGCGLITVFIRYFGSYNEGVCYSIMVMNLFVPFIDKYTKPVRFGTVKSDKKEGAAK